MSIVGRVAAAFTHLFGPLADEAAQASGVIQRRRVFTPRSLAPTFVLGFLHRPDATDEQLAQMAASCGAPVTTQAVEQRQTSRLANFLEQLYRRAVRVTVGSDRALAPLVERLSEVTRLDSTVITLPNSEQQRFPSCGGRDGTGLAALKLQTELDLRSGALRQVEIETGRSADNATSRQHVRRGPGAVRISDLGYCCLAVFAAMTAAGEHFLSRLQFGTHVYRPDGTALDLLAWLAEQPGPWVDQPVVVGKEERLACRLIAWRVPPEQANRRRQKLREQHRRKWNRAPSAARLAWCDRQRVGRGPKELDEGVRGAPLLRDGRTGRDGRVGAAVDRLPPPRRENLPAKSPCETRNQRTP